MHVRDDRARGRPHLGPLQQVGLDEHAQMRPVAEGRPADVGS
jgi:hypothetical protein